MEWAMDRKVGGNAGKGRKKGVPNKITGALKDMILGALEAAHDEGGIAYLTQQAKDNPNAFMALVGRVLPMTVQGAGDEGEHKVTVTWLKP